MSSKTNLLFQVFNICLLSMLAFLVVDFFEPIINAKNKTIIKYNIPSDDKDDMFSGQKAITAINKHFLLQTFTLTGNDKKDEKILLQFNDAVRRNSKLKHTAYIIRLNLGENISYGRFIGILSLMKNEDYKRYFEWDGYFYVITRNIYIPGLDLSPQRL